MRFFALETDLEALKKKFLVEGENAVYVSHRHFMAFVVHAFWPVAAGIAAAIGAMAATAAGILSIAAYVAFLAAFVVVELSFLFRAWTQWRYNFLIVTTQKVVIVEQSTFSRQIHPLPFASISNTRVLSQFGGIFRCGILLINTTVPERGGKYQEIPNPYFPKPENIAAVIENGLVLTKQTPKESEARETKEKMQEPVVSDDNPHPESLPDRQPA